MSEMVIAIVVDNGEPTLGKCIESLRCQTVPVRVVVAVGQETDLELATKLADKVYPPMSGIGKARVNAILNEKDNYMLSCDSDTCYAPNYAEIALQDLKLLNAVKAGTIFPLDNPPADLLVAWTEMVLSPFVPYEFCIAFRRDAFLAAKIHELDYDDNARGDIGLGIQRRMFPLLSDPRMVCWTRLPTKGAVIVRDNYLPSMLGVAIPFGALGSLISLSELRKFFG